MFTCLSLQISNLLKYLKSLNVPQNIISFHLLLPGLKRTHSYESGILFQVLASSGLDSDVLLEGGRYDKLIAAHRGVWNPTKKESLVAVGLRLNIDKLVPYLDSRKSSIDEKDQGVAKVTWPSGGPCDVLITSLGSEEFLEER
jgi:histidyl-tRNA synthetase